MLINFNNKETEIAEGTTCHDLAQQFTVRGVVVPVNININGEPIRIEDFKTTEVKEGDTVIIVRSVFGG